MASTPSLPENPYRLQVQLLQVANEAKDRLRGIVAGLAGPDMLSPTVRADAQTREAPSPVAAAGAGSTSAAAAEAKAAPAAEGDEEELDLLVSMVGLALREGPRREQASAA